MKTQNFFFRMKDDQNKDLNYWKENCKDDYLHTPISVLKYITELESKVNNGVLDDVMVSEKDCRMPMREFGSNKCLICGKQVEEH